MGKSVKQLLTHQNKDLREIAKVLSSGSYDFTYQLKRNYCDRKHIFETLIHGQRFSVCYKERFSLMSKPQPLYQWISVRHQSLLGAYSLCTSLPNPQTLKFKTLQDCLNYLNKVLI